MIPLAANIAFIDLQFHGRSRVIASVVLQGPGGVAIIDPGPASTLPTLRRHLADAGIAVTDITALLLTHIHLDHAGAAGTLARENPALRVYVHEIGAPHMADPAKLVASATRLYGDAMDHLWGEFAPVPRAAIVPLTGGERITAGGRAVDVAYTPGHAAHHVSYFSGEAGIAFVGDTAGVMVVPHGFVIPPTPPPDIDLEQWHGSLATIARWNPDTVFLTHFGPAAPVAAHLAELGDRLEVMARIAKDALAREGEESAKEAWFMEQIRGELRRRLSESDAAGYEAAGRFDLNWRGLARYWRKKA